MKRTMLMTLVVLLLAGTAWAQSTTGVTIGRGPNYDRNFWRWVSPTNKGVGLRWMDQVENLLGAGIGLGTGKVFYVDSGVANEGDGSSWTNAKNTLDEALNLCTANRGDVIFVAQGHAENIGAANAVDADVAGITIIGLGNGSDRPTFTWTATAGTFAVGAAGVTIEGLRFKPGISAVVVGISVEAAGDYFTMRNCEFVEPGTATYEFYDMVALAAGANYATIEGNQFISTVTSTGCNQAIDLDAGIVDRCTIVGNEFQGNFAVAAIHSDKVNTNMLVAWNTVHQQTSGQLAIEFTAAATGNAIGNTMYTNAYATCFDPGSLKCFENYAVDVIDESAYLIPAPGDSTINYLGINSANNDAVTSTVASNEDGSALERLEDLADLRERCTTKTMNPIVSDDLFVITGGPVEIISLVGYVTTIVESRGNAMKLLMDPCSPATDTDMCVAGETNGDAVGTCYVIDPNFANALIQVTNGVVSGIKMASEDNEIFRNSVGIFPTGDIESNLASSSSTGQIVWYCRWRPLVAGAKLSAHN